LQGWPKGLFLCGFPYFIMPRDTIILECTEARNENQRPSRYMSTRNKKVQTERVEKKKYNRFLKRHTLHRELKTAK
jgi:large subunit ribosomal protein L33